MHQFARFISLLFHPLLIPVQGSLAFLLCSPEYLPEEGHKPLLISVGIITLIIPLIFYLLLKKLDWVSALSLPTPRERIIPLAIYLVLLYLVIYRILHPPYTPELRFYFTGLIGAFSAALLLSLLKYKTSLHMIGLSALAAFIFGLSFHYQVNLTFALSMLVIALGAMASSRLYLGRHDFSEIITGTFIGAFTQFMTFGYWL